MANIGTFDPMIELIAIMVRLSFFIYAVRVIHYNIGTWYFGFAYYLSYVFQIINWI